MLDYITGFGLTIFEMLSCKIFFEAFGKKRKEKDFLWESGIVFGLIFSMYFMTELFYNHFLAKQIVAIIIISGFMTLYLKIRLRKALILSLLFEGLLLSIDYFTLWLNVLLFHSITEISESHYAGGLLVAILSKIILFAVVLAVRKRIGTKSLPVMAEREWLRVVLFPAFSIFTVIALLITSGNIENQRQESVFLAIAFCLAGMNLVVFYMIEDILKRENKIHENEIFRIQVKNQTDMYRSISENFDKQRKKAHEFKNQIMCIESLIGKKNYGELEEYVRKVSGRLRTEPDYIKTNNIIVNAILNSKYQEMLDKKILFIFKINDLSGLNISDEDVVIILSNLLNNAIEACERCTDRKYVKMKFMKEKDSTVISVRNPYEGELIITDGEIQTSKKHETAEHGVGIKNIIDVIERYQGSYVMRNNGNEFYFSVVIPCIVNDN
ncbi:GHKL domain-containing protein [Lachnospiraceae bacterium 54-11]|jgi:two-component system sensor histidine kinase AgrC|nr:GHKL domain-containing protein [Lachnospiraceae bacterium]